MLENHREIINPKSIIAFKPRQVLLAKLNMKHNKASSTGPDKKTLLHHAICQYLQNNGFSKTLKKFRSESKLDQDDNWKDVTLDLEEVYYQCLEKRSHTSTSLDGFQEQDLQRNGDARKDGVDNGVTSVETVSKKKKKKSDKNDGNAGDSQFQVKDEFNIATNFEEIKTLNLVPEAEVKSKTKKKRNMASVSMKEGAEQASSNVVKPTNDDVSQEELNEPSTKSKDKKKKKSNSSFETLVDKVDEYPSAQPSMTEGKSKDLVHSEDKSATDSEINIKSRDKKRKKEKLVSDSEDVGTNKEDKGSKKLKRAASEENSPQPVDNLAIEECKKDSEEYKPSKQLKEINASLGSDRHAENENKEDNVEVSQERTINQLGAQTDKNLDSNGGKSSVQKSLKKQQNGSAEPKTVNAFQRVKTDKVVFADERLQDNSYWAKDGADVGYGAKAQEILGQVRGRDFRHEKTKKKRGSYRGGQIDLQSHSVKFNYSDDDDED